MLAYGPRCRNHKNFTGFFGKPFCNRTYVRHKISPRRRCRLSALTGGASIELLTILETHIGNFYHSQATINLLGLREPLYMLLYYIFFQYASVSLAWQMKLSVWGEAAAATLIGSCLHQLVDQVGLAFLWWTWHNGEPLYTDRINGVPIASTFWVASTLFALAVVLRGVRAFASRHAPAKSSAVELSPLQVIAW